MPRRPRDRLSRPNAIGAGARELGAHRDDTGSDWVAAQTGVRGLSAAEVRRHSTEFLTLLERAMASGATTVNAAAFDALRAFLGELSRARAADGYSPSETATFVFSLKAPLFRRLPLETDEQRLWQVLRNFISNALKFTEVGEVRVSATADADAAMRFAVSDTGIGIAPEDQPRTVHDLMQVDGPVQRRVRGTGLGLSLPQKLATLLGGRIELESTPGGARVVRADADREDSSHLDSGSKDRTICRSAIQTRGVFLRRGAVRRRDGQGMIPTRCSVQPRSATGIGSSVRPTEKTNP